MNKNRKYNASARATLMWLALVLLFAWNQGGTVLWQAARLHHYQQRSARACRDTLSIPTISFRSGTDISWVEEDEIVYDGRMFDVKHIVAGEDVTLLIGHYDEEDDKLFKWLAELMGDDAPDTAKSKFTCWEFDATIPQRLSFHLNHITTAKPTYGSAPFTLFARNAIPPSPPPQC